MLEDKVVIVTGAGRGLGQAYAVEAARLGAKIVAGDVLDCGDTVRRIEADGGTAIGVELDVTKMGTVSAMAESAVDAFGGINVLVNNAALYGGLTGGRFDQLDEDEWDRCMNVNVKGIWNCCKAVVPHMQNAGGGSIVNVASLAATYGLPFVLHYTTSKAAVIGLTRGLAR
jgi:NAD(P)-dependent dehydrogenase (short-subunit alcohol dehydrogenase family)